MMKECESQINLLADGVRDRCVLGRWEAAVGFQSTVLSQDQTYAVGIPGQLSFRTCGF